MLQTLNQSSYLHSSSLGFFCTDDADWEKMFIYGIIHSKNTLAMHKQVSVYGKMTNEGLGHASGVLLGEPMTEAAVSQISTTAHFINQYLPLTPHNHIPTVNHI